MVIANADELPLDDRSSELFTSVESTSTPRSIYLHTEELMAAERHAQPKLAVGDARDTQRGKSLTTPRSVSGRQGRSHVHNVSHGCCDACCVAPLWPGARPAERRGEWVARQAFEHSDILERHETLAH